MVSAAITVLLAVLAWDAPRTLGPQPGLTGCIVLAASGATLTALVVSRPRRWSILVALLSVCLIAGACAASTLQLAHP